MPSSWYDRKRRGGRLTVHNGAGAWSKQVTQAINDFNGLSFRVILEPTGEKAKADIVILLSDGKGTKFPWGGREVVSDFDAASTHGQTGSFLDSRDKVEKAVIFLPEKLKSVSNDIKVLVIIHELIHACGLVEKNDHDPVEGILFAKFTKKGDQVVEAKEGKDLKPMPPIRVGGWTQGQMADLWKLKDNEKT